MFCKECGKEIPSYRACGSEVFCRVVPGHYHDEGTGERRFVAKSDRRRPEMRIVGSPVRQVESVLAKYGYRRGNDAVRKPGFVGFATVSRGIHCPTHEGHQGE